MKVLVASGTFKGTIRADIATDLIADVLHGLLPNASVERLMLADGGEGTLEAFANYFPSTRLEYIVPNAFGRLVNAGVLFLSKDVVLLESAQAIGISLLSANELDPYKASSYGVGELVKCAIRSGAKDIRISMGDSATMDMGLGMLDSLGVKFCTADGELIESPNLQDMPRIAGFDDSSLKEVRNNVKFTGLVDTNDFLCGEIGQVQLYGKQKGLLDADIPRIELAYTGFAELLQKYFGVDVLRLPGATGSGGLGAALHAFLGASLQNTLGFLNQQFHLASAIQASDLTVTGEGCLDNQTILGKVPYFVAENSRRRCVCIVGQYSGEGRDDLLNACQQTMLLPLNPLTSRTQPLDALREAAASLGHIL